MPVCKYCFLRERILYLNLAVSSSCLKAFHLHVILEKYVLTFQPERLLLHSLLTLHFIANYNHPTRAHLLFIPFHINRATQPRLIAIT